MRAAALKPYPAYKESSVDWLGKIPVDWDVRRMKYLLREQDARSSDGAEQLLRVSQYTGVTERKRADGGEEPDTRAESLVGYKCVEKDDLVVNIMLAWNGSMGVSSFPGIVSPAYCVYRFGPTAQPWYYHHLLRSPAYKARIKTLSTGVVESRLRLYTDHLYRLEALLPPLHEQMTIVRFLNDVDRRIRRYIRAKQKLIKLLDEQKQVIIHQAITGQIDVRTGEPYPAYRHTGVEWLGSVPQHWDVKKLKYLTKFTNGFAFKPSDWGDEGVPIIRIQNLNGSHEFNFTVREDIPEKLLIKPGDLLFSWSGNRGTSFGSFIWDRDFAGYLNQHIFKLHDYSLPRSYFAYLLRAVTRHVEQEQTHGIIGLVHVTKPQLGSVIVPVAPPDEQVAIAESIDEASSRLETLLRRAVHSIELIREYHTRLIADVVTGKLDVRDAAAKLTDKADGPDELLEDEDLLFEGDERSEQEAVLEEVDA